MSKVKINRAKYNEIGEDGEKLEAVFRVQTSGSVKKCDNKDCLSRRDRKILPMEKYARVYYEDVDAVEFFHYSCFREIFKRP